MMRGLLFVGLAAAMAEEELKFTKEELKELKVIVYKGPKQCGPNEKVKVAAQVSMHYTGWVMVMDDDENGGPHPGPQFDTSREVGVLERTIGVGEVIRGWDEGILGLCKGAKAILMIPPAKAYGANGIADVIPSLATLKFDVEIVDVTPPSPQP